MHMQDELPHGSHSGYLEHVVCIGPSTKGDHLSSRERRMSRLRRVIPSPKSFGLTTSDLLRIRADTKIAGVLGRMQVLS